MQEIKFHTDRKTNATRINSRGYITFKATINKLKGAKYFHIEAAPDAYMRNLIVLPQLVKAGEIEIVIMNPGEIFVNISNDLVVAKASPIITSTK
jgi:hypothetical protein